jgi:hypothetical protein
LAGCPHRQLLMLLGIPKIVFIQLLSIFIFISISNRSGTQQGDPQQLKA